MIAHERIVAYVSQCCGQFDKSYRKPSMDPCGRAELVMKEPTENAHRLLAALQTPQGPSAETYKEPPSTRHGREAGPT